MSSVLKEVDGKIVLNYSDTSVFRTNLFMLTFRKDNNELFQDGLKHYKDFLEFELEEYQSKNELHEKYLSLRAENLRTKYNSNMMLNINSEKVIFTLTRTYEDLLLKFLGDIFQTNFAPPKEVRKSDLPELPNRVVIKKYISSNNLQKIYSFPQNRRIGQETIQKAIQLLDS